jgi:hypothetical protein
MAGESICELLLNIPILEEANTQISKEATKQR